MKARVLFHLTLLAIVAGSLASVACSNQLQSKNASDAATGSITGTALFNGKDDNSGIIISAEQVEGIKSLSVQRMIAGQPPLASKDICGKTTTDKKGNYCMGGLSPGNYVVTASCNDSLEKAVSSYVQVVTSQARQVVVLYLTLPGQIAGKATLSDAASLPNANLGIVVFIAGTSYSALTAADGSYTITGIPPGKNYTLVASKVGYDSAITTVNVTLLQTTSAAPFALGKTAPANATGTITGIAQLAGSTNHAGIFVFLAGTSSIAATDQTGAWRLTGVQPGSYTLMANKDGYTSSSMSLSLAAGQSLDAGSLSLDKIPGTISGTLAAPLFSPGAGTYPGPQLVTVTSSSPGA
jgi:hypothetical protein